MFSQTVEYALRVMVCLADQSRPATTKQIAACTNVPAGYLAKVIQSLGRAGLVRSQRGLHGGSVLARPASAITAWDVVDAIDPVRRIAECPLGSPGHDDGLCPLHRQLDDALAKVHEVLARSTLADLIAVQATGVRPCVSVGAGRPAPRDPAARFSGVRASSPASAGPPTAPASRPAPRLTVLRPTTEKTRRAARRTADVAPGG